MPEESIYVGDTQQHCNNRTIKVKNDSKKTEKLAIIEEISLRQSKETH